MTTLGTVRRRDVSALITFEPVALIIPKLIKRFFTDAGSAGKVTPKRFNRLRRKWEVLLKAEGR
jgi:hypothetical protein